MFLDTPRLRDGPRDEKAGMTDDSEDYSCGYTTGCLGMWTPAPTPPPTPLPEYEPALRMTVGCRGPTAPKVFKDVVKPSNVKHQPGLINRGKNAPALKMTVRITRTMREQRNRDSNRGELRDTPRQICYGYTTPDMPQIRHARYARYAMPDMLQIRL